MNYNIHCEKEDNNIPLKERLLKARNISDSPDDFFNPTFSRYRQSPREIHDMEKAVARIIQAIEKKEKIMIFGDYDVDGVCSSFSLYKFFKEFFKGFTNSSLCTLHLDVLYGENDHHKIEAVFKGFGRAVKSAIKITSNSINSTKGVL